MITSLHGVLCLLLVVNGWHIEVNYNVIIKQLTTNVTFLCLHNNMQANQKSVEDILIISIQKLEGRREWKSLAHITNWESVAKSNLKATRAQGEINTENASSSFLKLHKDLATEDDVGAFRCQIVGKEEGKGSLVFIETEAVNVTARDVSNTDALKFVRALIDKQSAMNKKKIQIINNGQTVARMEREQLTKFASMQGSNIINQVDIVNIEINNVASMMGAWPSGNYSILKPDTGCPYSLTQQWKFSSLRSPTKGSKKNFDNTSPTINLNGKVLQRVADRNYVYVEMCSMVAKEEGGREWPKGSYCIHRYSFQCPSGFSPGMMGVEPKMTEPVVKVEKIVNLPCMRHDRWIDNLKAGFLYCCRKDRSPDSPIELPRIKPFYLLRHGGQCQQVYGMTWSRQWIHYDYRGYMRGYVGTQPDGLNPGGTIELCYYTSG